MDQKDFQDKVLRKLDQVEEAQGQVRIEIVEIKTEQKFMGKNLKEVTELCKRMNDPEEGVYPQVNCLRNQVRSLKMKLSWLVGGITIGLNILILFLKNKFWK